MQVNIGAYTWELGGPYLTELRESNDILDNPQALQERMEEDGYILIRGFHDREQVLKARMEILGKLQQMGRLDPEAAIEEGLAGPEGKGAMFGGTNTDLPEYLKVVNSPKVMDFFSRYLGGEAITFDYKWLRAVAKGGATGAHYDIVYMGRGTPNLYTLWTPIGDTPMELGTLAVLPGSHKWERMRQTYGNLDVDRDNVEGWFSNDPLEMVEKFGGRWATTSFAAGDAIFFGMYTMHGSTLNTTNRLRISCDTRYQRKDEPADERWIGMKPKGHEAKNQPTQSMHEVRKGWGLE